MTDPRSTTRSRRPSRRGRDPLNRIDWPVATERLVLRRTESRDLEPTWRYRRLPEVREWIGLAPDDFEDYRAVFADPARRARQLIVQLREDPGMEVREDPGPPVIGDIKVAVEDGWAQHELAAQARGTQAELGWTFDPAFSGRGYATEAVRAVVGLCFGELGLRRVHAGCFAANERSWRLMERIGMRREEHSRATGLHRSGRWLDGMNYGLLAEEWDGAAS